MGSPNDSICYFLGLAWLAPPENASTISEMYEPYSRQPGDFMGKWMGPGAALGKPYLIVENVDVPLIF